MTPLLPGSLADRSELKAAIHLSVRRVLEKKPTDKVYERQLQRIFVPRLNRLTDELLDRSHIELTQGILYVNSAVFPPAGSIALFFGPGWGPVRSRVRQQNMDSEKKVNRGVFERQGPWFKNILSLANERRPRLFPILTFQERALRYPHVRVEPLTLSAQDQQDPKRLWNRSSELFKHPTNRKLLESFRTQLRHRYGRGFVGDREDAKSLLLNPLRIRAKYNAQSLIYLYHAGRSDHQGGLVFAASLPQDLSKDRCEQVLLQLQELVSNCFLDPLLIAETEFLARTLRPLSGDTYVAKYFRTTRDEPVPLVDNLRQSFKGDLGYQRGRRFDELVIKTQQELETFFKKVTGPQGETVRGYHRIAEEVFLTVAGIWDVLQISRVKRSAGSADDYRKRFLGRPRPARGPVVLDVLFRALDFEDQLKLVPSYREHFIHCFHAWCLGFWLLCLRHGGQFVLFDRVSERERIPAIRAWFVAALFHDIGYPVSKMEDVFVKIVQDFIHKGLEVRPQPKWSELLRSPRLQECFLGDPFLRRTGGALALKPPRHGLMPATEVNYRLVKALLTSTHHSVLGGLIVHYHLTHHRRAYRHAESLQDAILPILVHHAGDKEFLMGKEKKAAWWVNASDNPLAYLLVLCDALSELGRSFEGDQRGQRRNDGRLLHLKKRGTEIDYVVVYQKQRDANERTKYYKKPRGLLSPAGGRKLVTVKLACEGPGRRPRIVQQKAAVYRLPPDVR